MRPWKHVAGLVATKGLQGGLAAQSAPGLPFLLHEGLEVAFVPPVLDAPRRACVVSVRRLGQDRAAVVFDSVGDIATAKALIGCACLARSADLPDGCTADTESPLAGWDVVDVARGPLGHIVEVIERPAQSLLVVRGGFGEILIPFVEAFVVSRDEGARLLTTQIPPGLLECAQ